MGFKGFRGPARTQKSSFDTPKETGVVCCFVFKTNKGKRAQPGSLHGPSREMALVGRVDGEKVPCPRRVQLQFGLCGRPRASQALSGLLTTSLKGRHYHPHLTHKQGSSKLRELSKALHTTPRRQGWGGGAGWCGCRAPALLALTPPPGRPQWVTP